MKLKIKILASSSLFFVPIFVFAQNIVTQSTIVIPDVEVVENTLALCTDGIDNDGDTLVDSSDPDCIATVEVVENTLALCTDGNDNDGDTLVDSSDPSCIEFVEVVENTLALCTDGNDNDGDTLVDSSDPSCIEFVEVVENTLALCTDGNDNDGDTLVDSSDPSCIEFVDSTEITPIVKKPRSSVSGGGSRKATSSKPKGEVLGESTEFGSCKVLTTFMKMGQTNNIEEVKMLQIFLNAQMNANLPITGFFGPLTLQAVKDFQVKHKTEILKPWVDLGLMANDDIGTGYVYKTTQYAINKTLCPATTPVYPTLN